MTDKNLSVIIPAYNRADALARTLASLTLQTMPAGTFEIIVIDNGSVPLIQLPSELKNACTLVRLEKNKERCHARNHGAELARGSILLFLDDDLEVSPGFVEAHDRAHREWPGSLIAGMTVLPPALSSVPFVRFRQRLEEDGMPTERGLTSALATVAGGNMSIERQRYLNLHGFLPELAGIEDVDFTRRHVEAGGTIAYIPEAVATHWDHALDIRTYYRRTLFAAQCSVRLARHHPTIPSYEQRARVNGPLSRQDKPAQKVKKVAKYLLGQRPFIDGLLFWTNFLERTIGAGRFLDAHYSLLLGIAWLHGYRRGLAIDAQVPSEQTTLARQSSTI